MDHAISDTDAFLKFCHSALAEYNYLFFQNIRKKGDGGVTHDSNGVVSLEELLEFVDIHFEELHNPHNLISLLPLLQCTIQFEVKTTHGQIPLKGFLEKLICRYKRNKKDQKLVLQVIYHLLNSVTESNRTDIAEKTSDLFHELSDLLFSCDKSIASNVLICLQLQVKKFQRSDLLELLWHRIAKQRNNDELCARIALILVHLIDDLLEHKQTFYCDECLVEYLQIWLTSKEREQRKAALYIIRKMTPHIVKGARELLSGGTDKSESLNYSWSAYATILESLEENQSHLILPTLATIKNITLDKVWLELLYRQLLKQGNCLILRWIIEHILDNFRFCELSGQLLQQFLEATNETNLYNPDNYCIPQAKLKNFLEGELNLLFKHFIGINWKSVPMYFWFSIIEEKNAIRTQKIAWETLMNISIRVRALQNKNIRSGVRSLFYKIFYEEIDALDFTKYLKLMESLLNPYETDNNWNMLIRKLTELSIDLSNVVFTKRVYEIFTDYIKGDIEKQDFVLRIFRNMPKEKHGWFRFIFVYEFEITKNYIDFCHCKYGIDFVESIRQYSWKDVEMSERRAKIDTENAADVYREILGPSHPINFWQWFNEFIAKSNIIWQEDEKEFVSQRAFDHFATKYVQLQNDLSLELTQILLCKGGKGTVYELSNIQNIPGGNAEFFDYVLQEIGRFSENTEWCYAVYRNLFNSIQRNLSKELMDKYTRRILKMNEGRWRREIVSYMALFDSNLAHTNMDDIIEKIFQGGIIHGDARTELLNECKIPKDLHKDFCCSYDLCSKAIDHFLKSNDEKLYIELIKYLLNMNYTLSCKRPRYFENSPVHVIKMRIAIAVCKILRKMPCKYFTDSYWHVILEENNQLNINYIFERIIAFCAPNIDEISKYLTKLSKYPPAQQVSIIIICYLYCCIHWPSVDNSMKEKIIYKILPFTMGANFQIRLYSQLVIYKILMKWNENEIEIGQNLNGIMQAIHSTLEERLDEFLNDIRLTVEDENILNCEEIFYVTNAPLDEVPYYLLSELSQRREEFCKKQKEKQRKYGEENGIVNVIDVQRKIDPFKDILPGSDLISYPEYKLQKERKNDVVVVASLIDKLQNLGGIARTCEVLGIKNFVLHSITYIHSKDFKNISMTAENGLIVDEVKRESLYEFLLQKQLEGYEIVGAEQTANSQSFVGFKFPKRCIILLGHEKEGIPPNLLSILNHTVEIPQFGLVRSLNVHVSAALFMWEYCKQHII